MTYFLLTESLTDFGLHCSAGGSSSVLLLALASRGSGMLLQVQIYGLPCSFVKALLL